MGQPARNLYEPISFGIDWITATAKSGAPSLSFERIADCVWDERKSGDGAITAASRLGYVGRSSDGFFHGRRPDGNCIIISGQHCDPLAADIILSATNVSRIDLQVTFWTGGEQPHLGVQAYEHLKRLPPKTGRPPTLSLTTGWPDGETCNVNKRVSDVYMRIYDKAAEASMGLPRTLWRYEIEYKRKPAMRTAIALAEEGCRPTRVYDQVAAWTTNKGLQWPGPTSRYLHSEDRLLVGARPDDLGWIRDSLAKHIAKRVNSHGLWPVVIALGLDGLVQPIPTKSEETQCASKPLPPDR